MLTVDLLRHGEPEGGKRYRGQSDDPLSQRGWRQMEQAVQPRPDWDAIVSSPLSRCRAFAEFIAGNHVALEIEPALKEIGFGQWEGKTVEEVMAQYGDALTRFWQDPVNQTPPGAEKLKQFQLRVHSALDALVGRYREGHILLVVHAGVIRMALQHVLGFPLHHAFRLNVPYACLTRIAYDFDGEPRHPQLIFHHGRL